MREPKQRWRFGLKTENNNHKTHHLKMLIMLDHILSDDAAMLIDTAAVREHLRVNTNSDTGVSIDYLERDALYYHVYNLEP